MYAATHISSPLESEPSGAVAGNTSYAYLLLGANGFFCCCSSSFQLLIVQHKGIRLSGPFAASIRGWKYWSGPLLSGL